MHLGRYRKRALDRRLTTIGQQNIVAVSACFCNVLVYYRAGDTQI